MHDAINDIIEVLVELESDGTVPRNVKQKLNTIMLVLRESTDLSIRIDRALQELEEITDDSNLQPHIRTQLWNVVSMLEKTSV